MKPPILLQTINIKAPLNQDIFFVSIDHIGSPSYLNQFVLESLGVRVQDLPDIKDLHKGHYLWKIDKDKAVIFIVTVSNKPTNVNLQENLVSAFNSYANVIEDKMIRIPLLGTEDGKLDHKESFNIIFGVLTQSIGRIISPKYVTISLPVDIDEDIGKEIETMIANWESGFEVDQNNKASSEFPSESSISDDAIVLKHALSTEKEDQVLNQKGYSNQGLIGYIYSEEIPQTRPLHQVLLTNVDDYFYYIDRSIERLSNQIAEEKVIGYLSVDSNNSHLPLRRYFVDDDINFDHFYCTNPNEELLKRYEYQIEGNGFDSVYLLSEPGKDRKPLYVYSFNPVVRLFSPPEIEGANQQGKSNLSDQTDSIPFHLDYVEEIDRLNREPIAKSIARLLNNQIFRDEKKMRHSFMVHLQGAWGDGKSTFLNLLSKHLKGVNANDKPLKEEESRWVVVDFNAWRHQHIDQPWWIFLDTIYKHIQKSKIHKFGIWWRERWWRLVTLNGYYWITFLIFLGVFVLMMLVFGFKSLNLFSLIENTATNKDKLSVIISYISIVISGWTLIKALSGSLLPATSEAANEFRSKVRDPMIVLKTHFEEVIGYMKEGRNVAVFIDDLDRCNAEFTVGLLEGIQTLFKEQAVLYVVAGDRHWISTCFENHYEKYKDVAKEPAQRLGHLFLEKAFQLSIRLPKISGNTKKTYWDFILNPTKKEDKDEGKMETGKKEEVKKSISSSYDSNELIKPKNMQKIVEEHKINIEQATDLVLEVMDEKQEDIKHLLQNYHHLIDANPRGVKRLANQYTVYRNILTAEGREFKREKLFRWLIMQNKFPMYTDWLETHIDQMMVIL
jgi:hypothetical protein